MEAVTRKSLTMSERKALVVEVDAATQLGLLGFLGARGYQCVAASSPEEALEALAEGGFSFTLIDLGGDGTDSTELMECLKLTDRNTGPIIAIASRPDAGLAGAPFEVAAMLHKPLSLDELQYAIDKFVRPQAEALGPAPEQLGGRIRREMELWCSSKMLEARQIIREAARVDVTVLVTGETGTGKELVARAIHHFSVRRAGAFVKVNCAAMPRELLESELFGYERGAFTGAHKLKIGKFEAAHRGTIFLDEIGDLHPALQAKLLHVLQDGEFSRIGGKSTLSVDVRVLAATNQDLERAVAEGRFREDLFYRLNVIHVLVPPLRERSSEIPLLVDYFVERYAKLYRRDGFVIPPSVIERLTRHRYPGNVRELENLIKRMIVLDDPFMARIPLRDVTPNGGLSLSSGSPADPTLTTPEPSLKEIGRRASQAAEREAIAKTLEQTGWNRVRAARALRISYRALLYKIKQAGLDAERSSTRPAL
jgi:two-component system, NtrC family, response regulator AtoC